MREKQIIINVNPTETRVAVLEDSSVSELFIERSHQLSLIGNIYKGKVNRVLPGIQSAFVEIGADKSGFLFSAEVVSDDFLKQSKTLLTSTTDDLSIEEIEQRTKWKRTPIEKVLREGQDILVQVIKEPFNSKGARLSMFLSFPGRYLVVTPFFDHIGISKKLVDDVERDRLRTIIEKIKPSEISVIVRTAAQGVSEEVLAAELAYLLKQWETTKALGQNSSAPSNLHRETDLSLRVTRDFFTPEVKSIVVDDKSTFSKLETFLSINIPIAKDKLEYYDNATPIFDLFGVEVDIGLALNRKIELPSGGYLIVDQTEALTTFDINTGKFVGRHNSRDTVLKTNKEALIKIAAQLRLRNIGGIIVIDFIDMEDAVDREIIYNELVEELKQDRAKTNVLRVSELGLVQMTRKRTNDSLENVLLDQCPYCNGRSKTRSTVTEAHDLLRELVRIHLQTKQTTLKVVAREDIIDWINTSDLAWLNEIKSKFNMTVNFTKSDITLNALHKNAFDVSISEK